jgi:hypothetical protein
LKSGRRRACGATRRGFPDPLAPASRREKNETARRNPEGTSNPRTYDVIVIGDPDQSNPTGERHARASRSMPSAVTIPTPRQVASPAPASPRKARHRTAAPPTLEHIDEVDGHAG